MAIDEHAAAAAAERPRASESTPLLTTPRAAAGGHAPGAPPPPLAPLPVPPSRRGRPARALGEDGGPAGGPAPDDGVRGATSLPAAPPTGWLTWSPFRVRPAPAAADWGAAVGAGGAAGGGSGDAHPGRRAAAAVEAATSRRRGRRGHGGGGGLDATILGAMARAESSGARPSASERYMVPVLEADAEAAVGAASPPPLSRSASNGGGSVGSGGRCDGGGGGEDGGGAGDSPGGGGLSSGGSWRRLVAAAADSDGDSDVDGRAGAADGAGTADVDGDGGDGIYAAVVDVGASIVERRFGVHELGALRGALRAPLPHSTAVRWIHVNGVCDGYGGSTLLDALSGMYGLHPLACEDVLMTPQRPKVEQYELVDGEDSGIFSGSDDDGSDADAGGADADAGTGSAAAPVNGSVPLARAPSYTAAASDGSDRGGYGGGGGASLFVVCHSHELRGVDSGYALTRNQVSLFLLADAAVVISFQERAGASPQSGDWLTRVRSALAATVLARGRGALPDAAHVVYLMMDAVVDQLFVLCEFFGFRIDELEGALLAECGAVVVGAAVDEEAVGGRLAGSAGGSSGGGDGPPADAAAAPPPSVATPPSLMAAILRLRWDLLTLRRTVWPLRDVLSKLLLLVPESGAASAAAAGRAVDSTASVGSDSGGGVGGVFRTAGGRRRGGRGGGARRGRDVRPFLRDVMDHMLQVMDILESYRSVVGGLMELYLGNANNRMQEIMKTLTVVVR